MNILPKKRWHVRTKENIARVRKDEAEAAEKEKQEKIRTENADREARINILKFKSREKLKEAGIDLEIEKSSGIPTSDHINLFADLDHAVKTTNKEHDREAKEKVEDYEKKIGYLTYLGQDTNEALKKKNWYEVLPESSRFTRNADVRVTYDKLVLKDEEGKPKNKVDDEKNGEVGWKSKQRHDPVNSFKEYCHEKYLSQPATSASTSDIDYIKLTNIKNKRKKHKKDKQKKNKADKLKQKAAKLHKLREARLKREKDEKHRTELFLTGQNKAVAEPKESNNKTVKAKYNSQFNPELARQNYK